HVGLGLECFDRIYLNGWVPTLQVPGQVVSFLTRHLGFPISSPALLERIGLRFRKTVTEFAAEHDIPVVRFAKGNRLLRPLLAAHDPPAPLALRQALRVINHHVDDYIREARMAA
ncbi:MAG: hypothetical protein WCC38_14340, partial [Pseudonocardiaceae bacterium]